MLANILKRQEFLLKNLKFLILSRSCHQMFRYLNYLTLTLMLKLLSALLSDSKVFCVYKKFHRDVYSAACCLEKSFIFLCF